MDANFDVDVDVDVVEDEEADSLFASPEYWQKIYASHAGAGDAATFDCYRDFAAISELFTQVLVCF